MYMMDFIKVVPSLYHSRTPLFLRSIPGLGKTSVLRNEVMQILTQKLGKEGYYSEDFAPGVDAAEISGFTVPHKTPDGGAKAIQLRSYLLPPEEYMQPDSWGLKVIEELPAADNLTQKGYANVLLDKKYGQIHLPKNYWVIATGNRLKDKAGANRVLSHVINRMRVIDLEPHALSFTLWAEREGIHPLLIAFAKARPGVIFGDDVAATGEPFCSARSFVSAANFLADVAGADKNGNPNMEIPTSGLIKECVIGDIGSAATTELFQFTSVHTKLPTIREIYDDPTGAKCPQELDAAYAAMQMCIHHADPTNVDKLWTYAERFPKELQTSAAKALIEKGGGALVNSKALGKWIMENRALIINSLD